MAAVTARDDQKLTRWYVVHTQPHAEQRAVENLERQFYRTYCPFITRTIRHARKFTRSTNPLFPSYLFVSLDLSQDQWRSINGTRGVIRLLTQGDAPIPVPEGVVEAIQAKLENAGSENEEPQFQCGQLVQVCGGPFTDLMGHIERLDSNGRVRVLLDLMGRAVSVCAQVEVLRSAG